MRVVVELDNIDSVKHAAIIDSGVAFLPMLTVRSELASGSLKVIQCDRLELTRPLGIIQRRDVSLSRAARSFMDLVMKNRIWDQENMDSSGSLTSEESAPEASKSIGEDSAANKPSMAR
jgi:hypothetical protein